MLVGFPLICLWAGYQQSQQKKEVSKIGRISCKRCNYIGSPKAVPVRGKGMVAACSKCGGEDWVLAEEG